MNLCACRGGSLPSPASSSIAISIVAVRQVPAVPPPAAAAGVLSPSGEGKKNDELPLLLLLLLLLLRRLSFGSCQPPGGIPCKLLHKNKSESAYPRLKTISSGHIQPSKPCVIAFVAERENSFFRQAIFGYRPRLCFSSTALQILSRLRSP